MFFKKKKNDVGEMLNDGVMAYFPEPVIVDAFCKTLNKIKPTYVLDIGSRDCKSAISFKKASKNSRVIAFEANPENYFDYCLRPAVMEEGVVPQFMALSNKTEITKIKIPDYATREKNVNRGVASLLTRENKVEYYKEYNVTAMKLDDFLLSENEKDQQDFVLWIDVEGATDRVLEGGEKTLAKTRFVKLEVEKEARWTGQKTEKEIIAMMDGFNFKPIFATDKPNNQYDIVFFNNEKFKDDANLFASFLNKKT